MLLLFIDYLEECEDLVEYFERTWIGIKNRVGRKRRDPEFAINLWNCYDVSINCDPRTTNAKGFHNGFQKLVAGDHPSIWRFFKAIQKQLVLCSEARAGQYRRRFLTKASWQENARREPFRFS